MNEFSLVKEVINEWDPFDLLAIHCPDDEYDEEIHDIVKVLPNIKDEEELASGIEQIMSKAFDKDFKKSKDCLIIAKKICKLFK